MIVLSHRGFWLDKGEKNQEIAFRRSATARFGVETDVRDHCGDLVVSHDPAKSSALPFHAFFNIFASDNLPLAVNIKSDGLAPMLKLAMKAYKGLWFAFDMSGPETMRYLDLGLPVFVRHSDIEPVPICYERAQGVWLDAFHSDWFAVNDIIRHLERNKQICIVSPELHGRNHLLVWQWLKKSVFVHSSKVLLCTDFPTRAYEYFELGNTESHS